MACPAGRFGFQKEMNALQSLSTGNEEEAFNVTALLRSTHEVETRVQEIYRCPSLLSTSAAYGDRRFMRHCTSGSMRQQRHTVGVCRRVPAAQTAVMAMPCMPNHSWDSLLQ